MKDFQTANGWSDRDQQAKERKETLEKCHSQGHVLQSRNIGRSLTLYTCPICDYCYKVDSSD